MSIDKPIVERNSAGHLHPGLDNRDIGSLSRMDRYHICVSSQSLCEEERSDVVFHNLKSVGTSGVCFAE